MHHYDCIVLGVGAVGSGALWHLARRGLRVLGLDRFPPGHDRGSSHGATRMIRQAYFEHPDYVPLVLRAYDQWRELERAATRSLYVETGLVQIGPPDGEVVPGVLASAASHGLDVEALSPADLAKRFPTFRVPSGMTGVFERRAGFLRVEDSIVTLVQQALSAGAQLHCGESVVSWTTEGHSVVVRTDHDTYHAGHLIIAAGAWSAQVLNSLGLPLVVRRKPQYWYHTTADHTRLEHGCPAWLYETGDGIFYGFPQIDSRGMKLAEHSGGSPVADPLRVDRQIDRADQARVERFVAEHLTGVSATLGHHAVCMYTISPDHHFYVDRHPEHDHVAFAAGLSGHGFKFAPVLGEAVVELALEGRSTLPVGFLATSRPG
ncbi:MAG: N-methyl-L-tryptophan oxidase [Planctomycetaceae bacterium]|nr:N-methyl-L-tryptophan oxidase [Planctomycetaceae bacterium]